MPTAAHRERWAWAAVALLLVLYVGLRMEAFTHWAEVATPNGVVKAPVTFASVDHPFHVARAETLWRELATGSPLRWIGQHQGGYPVEFYPLGVPWLEVLVRALSLGALPAEGAHSLAVLVIFLLPGVGFAWLARIDGWTPAVALLALALHISLPGGWYDGGYTELVQWGLVTNVAGAVAALLMLPPLVRYLATGGGWFAVAAAGSAAAAVHCNPRSILGLLAVAGGAWLAALAAGGNHWRPVTGRMALVGTAAALQAAPELLSLLRFGGLYEFVRYSGYDSVREYLANSVTALSWPVFVGALAGLIVGVGAVRRVAARSVAASLLLYAFLTAVLVGVPAAARLAPQLEPTRLMPLQRLLALYLAAVAVWTLLGALQRRVWPERKVLPVAVTAGLAVVILIALTRPLSGAAPDPADPAIVSSGLYPVAMSGQPQQVDLREAVRAADAAAAPGTAVLVLGSALSWHQQLWAPLWTTRPLFYDNWLWYWHPFHVGTPRYDFAAGHHYPDPEETLAAAYLDRHGIGAVVVTGAARDAAAASPLLRPLRQGVYDAFVVTAPVTTVTLGDANATAATMGNQRISATSDVAAREMTARVNWHPRWEARAGGSPAEVTRGDDGYLRIQAAEPAMAVELVYSVQPLDWVGRLLALGGVALLVWLAVSQNVGNAAGRRWYAGGGAARPPRAERGD